jgi:hypothetical protein
MDSFKLRNALKDVEHFEHVIHRDYEESDDESIIAVIDDDDWLAIDELEEGGYHLQIESVKVKNESFVEEDELEEELEKKLEIIDDVF